MEQIRMKGLFLSSSSLLDVILAQGKDDNSICWQEQHSELGPKKKTKKKTHIRFDLPVWVIWKHTLGTCCWCISLHKLIWRDSKFKTPLHHLLNKWCRLWNIYVWISSLAPLVSLFQFAYFFITFLPIYIFYVVLLMWKQKLIHCNFKNSKISFAAIIPENQFLI